MAIALELLWFRFFQIAFKSNAYTFAHFLGFILVGYGIGAYLGLKIKWKKPLSVIYGWVITLSLCYTLISLGLIAHGYKWVSLLVPPDWLLFQWSNWKLIVKIFFTYIVVPILILLPPNILLGMGYPFVQKSLQNDLATVGKRVSLIQMLGVLGNAAGGIITGLFLFDWLGTGTSLKIIGIIGLMVVVFVRSLRPAIPFLILGILITPSTQDLWLKLHSARDSDIQIFHEDATGVTGIKRNPENNRATLISNGTSQGEVPFYGVHVLLGSWAALIHPNPQSALVIGLGSAGTPYTIATNPSIARVDVVEIIRSQQPALQALASFPEGRFISPIFNDARFRLHWGDGRKFLTQTTNTYDIIEADAVLPWKSFSNMLNSQEFFTLAKSRLTNEGIMAHWASSVRVRRTFAEVFPYSYEMGLILLGSKSPIQIDIPRIHHLLQDPKVINHFESAGLSIQQAAGVLSTPMKQLEKAFDPNLINTDLHPKDEYYLNN